MPKRFHKRGDTIHTDVIEVGDVIRFSLWREPWKFTVGYVAKIEEVGGLKAKHFLNEAGVVLNTYPDQVLETSVIALAPYEPTEEEKRKDAKMAEFERLGTGTTFVRLDSAAGVGDYVVVNTKVGSNDTWTQLHLYADGDKGLEYTYTDPLFEDLYDGNTFPEPVE